MNHRPVRESPNPIPNALQPDHPSIGMAAWADLDPSLQTRLRQALQPDCHVNSVVYPTTPAELTEVMQLAHQHQWRVLPWGGGSKLSWGGLAGDLQLGVGLGRLARLIDHAVGDLTVTVEAGMRIAALQAVLAKKNQFLAIDPLYIDTATVGGIIATADTGALRQRYGGIRDMLIGVSFVRSDGHLAHAGGRVVKNVAGYDLMKLLTGSYGTLGVICEATWRVYPLPSTSHTLGLSGSKDAIAHLSQRLLASTLTPTAVELIAPQTAAVLGLGSTLTLLVRFQSSQVSVAQQMQYLEDWGQALNLQATGLGNSDDAVWQQLTVQMQVEPTDSAVTCKIGVLPTHAVDTLHSLSQLPELTAAQFHAGSGLGMVRFHPSIAAATLTKLRMECQTQGGFLTLLNAPIALKQQIDVWGYSGEALPVMQRLKAQFDPANLLNPNRFVGGI